MQNEWVNKKYQESKVFSQEYNQSKPFSHIVVKDFLLQEKAKAIAEALQKEHFTEKEADIFKFKQTKEIDGTKNNVLQEFYGFFSSPKFLEYIEQITGVKNLKSIDMSGFIYSDTDYLLCHDDCLEDRKIAYIYNLSKNFTETDGGTLQFFSVREKHPVKIAKSIVPTFNTLILFTVTRESFHQVQEITSNKKRLTLAGWFHG